MIGFIREFKRVGTWTTDFDRMWILGTSIIWGVDFLG